MNTLQIAHVAEFSAFDTLHPGLQYLDAFIIDANGAAVGKRVPWDEARRVFEAGIAFSACAPLLDCRGRGHNAGGLGASDGDPDGIALPLAGTLARVPWASAPTAQVVCAMHEAGTRAALWFDERVVLAGIVEQCRARGLHPVLACELEFYLVDRARGERGELRLAVDPQVAARPTRPTNLSLDRVEEQASLLGQIALAARAQNIPLGNVAAEYGIGQFEVNLKHVADPMLAADHAVLLRRLIRGVARAQGADATFMAKPFKDQPGNGLHVHVSLVDETGRNRFGSAGGERLLAQAIAGMQALMFDSVALFAPNYNSFRRFLGPYVPNTPTWGHNNRSVAFRIPTSGAADRRIEHRVAGADASPHLAVAAILAAVLHGIDNDLLPDAEISGRAVTGRDPAFPRSLWDALQRLEQSAPLARYFERRYLEAYAHLKRGEFETLLEDISARETDFYA